MAYFMVNWLNEVVASSGAMSWWQMSRLPSRGWWVRTSYELFILSSFFTSLYFFHLFFLFSITSIFPDHFFFFSPRFFLSLLTSFFSPSLLSHFFLFPLTYFFFPLTYFLLFPSLFSFILWPGFGPFFFQLEPEKFYPTFCS